MPAKSELRISAKNLGALALPGFCPRCFWLGMHYDLPFGGPFPGIFSSLDSFSKKVVHAHFDRFRSAPPWLSPLGRFVSYIQPPSARTFHFVEPTTGIRLTGAPDGILVGENARRTIIDYKTGRHTAGQDQLLPMYEVQLNGYALIADRAGFGPVDQVALVYTEPVTEGEPDFLNEARTEDGFRMGFQAKVVPVELDPGRMQPLMQRVREIYDQEGPPTGTDGCEDCADLDALLKASRTWAAPAPDIHSSIRV